MNKYGIENFHIELIEEVENDEIACEREIFWINQLRTYVGFEDCNGYNATLGGDGKAYIDYQKVIDLYQNDNYSQKEIAKILNISADSVHNILISMKVPLKTATDIIKTKYAKKVVAYDKKTNEFIIEFSSYTDAANWLIDNHYTNCKFSTIRTHIGEVCSGKRKSAAGFIWKNKD